MEGAALSLSLTDVVRCDFRTSRAADELNARFQGLLGLPHRYGPARLALGRSLGLSTKPTLELTNLGLGKSIRGEHLFGQGLELATWTCLIVQHANVADVSRQQLQALVAAHWHRGIYLLWEDWKASGYEFDKFVARLVRHSQNKRST